MGLTTVRVPAALEPLFTRAEEIVSRYFAQGQRDPEHGTIEVSGERYVLVRAAALSVEFFTLVEELYGPGREAEADEFARNILFDLAHAVGRSDAQAFHTKMDLTDPLARLAAGPVHFSHAGWAFVDILPESSPAASDAFYLLYDHPYSFESDAWIRAGVRRANPVCIMNAGYSSGWCEESFGVTLVSVEVLCRARGDDACRFIMAHPSRIEAHVERWRARAPSGSLRAGSPAIPDFFARKRTEDALRKAQGDLERRVDERTRELSLSNERLVREIVERERAEAKLLQTYKLEAVGRLAGGIAHDFNNLMAIIAVNCGILRRHLPEGDPLRRLVDDIGGAGERATTLTRQLLAFSRAQPRRGEVLDLNRIVADLGRMLERVLGEDVLLVTRLDPDLGAVEQDRGHMEQVLMNLVVNARDAMPGGGTLTIETANVDVDAALAAELGGAEPGPRVVLSVRDTGKGMDEATLGKIFDPFFTTKEGGEGTGLGLSTVYGIVQQSGGAIGVSSKPGQGTRFSIYLPRVGAEVPAPSPPRREEEAAPGTGESILLVEDQRRLREVIALVLRDVGYRVLEAADAEDAIRIAEDPASVIDLLLTDVVMPRLGGPEVAARIRAARPGVRVLFMSGYADDAVLARGGSIAGAEVLSKPFEADVLAARVRAVLDAPSG